jgi:hypothetical protein
MTGGTRIAEAEPGVWAHVACVIKAAGMFQNAALTGAG